ncbi:MAG: hypothetical protein WA116_05240 [Anaerolineaceae bacterium]
MSEAYSLKLEREVIAILDVPEADSQSINKVWIQLSESIAKQKNESDRKSKTALKGWAFAGAMFIFFAIGIVAIGPKTVWATVSSWFLPGVGIVEDVNQISVLEKQVVESRDGYTVTIENLVTSPERTWLRIKVDGSVENPEYFSQISELPEAPYLQVDPETKVAANHWDIYYGEALYAEYQFPAISNADNSSIILFLPQIPQTQKGFAPEDWVFNLVMRKSTMEDVLPERWSNTRSSATLNGISLEILQILHSPNKTYLTIRFQTPTLNDVINSDWSSQIILKDDQGQSYPVTFDKSIDGSNRTFLVHTSALSDDANMVFTLSSLTLATEPIFDSSEPNFSLDLGQDPFVGQHWQLDEWVEILPYKLHVVGADLQKDDNSELRLVFSVEDQQGLADLMLRCAEPVCTGSRGGGGSEVEDGFLRPAILLSEHSQGKLQIKVVLLSYNVQGPWEIYWTPGSIPGGLQINFTPPEITEPLPTNPTITPAREESQIPLTTNAVLAQEVEELINKGFEYRYGESGWIHSLNEQIEAEDSELYTSGRQFGVRHSINESWTYIDEQGQMLESVTIGKTVDGEIISEEARVGTTFVNFTTGDANELTESDMLPLKSRLAEEIRNSGAEDIVTTEEEMYDGRDCLFISIRDNFVPAKKFGKVSKPLAGIENRYWLDLKTGLILKNEVVFHLEDSTEITWWQTYYRVMEHIGEPPTRVFELLDQVTQ